MAEEEGDDENADGVDDFSDLLDRSPSSRMLLFSTLSHFLSLPPATFDASNVDVVVASLDAHAPLLPRELARVTEVWMHVGREEEAAAWLRRLIAHPSLDAATLLPLSSRARTAGMKALERRLNDVIALVEGRGRAATETTDGGAARAKSL